MRLTKVSSSAFKEYEFDGIATDKSISHRSAMFALLASSKCDIKGYLQGEDTINTLHIAQSLGLGVERKNDSLIFIPPKSIKEPSVVLDCGNAGTAMRLFAGLLSGVKGHFVLSGDKYLNNRPMKRIIEPLSSIGARIFARDSNNLAPLSIIGSSLKSFDYKSPIASAQVKSAMILAGLHAEGESRYVETHLSRDHTERILKGMGANINTNVLENGSYEVVFGGLGHKKLDSLSLEIPADPSSAFFFAVAACVCRANVKLKNVLLNPTRIEAFKVLAQMGAKVSYELKNALYEDIGDIEISGKELRGVVVDSRIAWLIDEIPALAVCFAIAKGTSEVHNAKELRVKESDRISATISGLRAMGIECEDFEDGFKIKGGELKSARVNSFGDHRIAMSFAIAGLACGVEIEDSECIDVSFPNFLQLLSKIATIENITT